MTEYTPTTEEVRAAWVRRPAGRADPWAKRQFDRWLAAHDAEVALDASALSGEDCIPGYETTRHPAPNPYREGTDND